MTSERRRIRVAVVGGGVAGLSAAFRLRQLLRAAGAAHDLVLYEQRDACGGATRTDRVAGFALDHGPSGWPASEPFVARLVDELGMAGELVRASEVAGRRFIFTRNRLHRLPDSPGRFLVTRLLRPWEKMRAACELLAPGRDNDADETIEEFGRRRLGRGFTESILDPMVSGLIAGDVGRLSLPATFPKLRAMELEHGGLCRALLARRWGQKPNGTTNGPSSATGGALTTLRGGAGRLSESLAQAMSANLRAQCTVRQLIREDGRFTVCCDGSKERFDAVVIAAPAHRAAGIVKSLAPEAAAALAQIEFAGAVVVCQAYDLRAVASALDGFGHLIPRRDGIRALGTLWTSSVFPHQAPRDKLLLRTTFGGARDARILALGDEQLIALAAHSSAQTLGIQEKPLGSWVFRHPLGIAQYTLGHRQRVAVVDAACQDIPGLALVGASYRGVSLSQCIRDAYIVAPRVLRHVGLEVCPAPEGDARTV